MRRWVVKNKPPQNDQLYQSFLCFSVLLINLFVVLIGIYLGSRMVPEKLNNFHFLLSLLHEGWVMSLLRKLLFFFFISLSFSCVFSKHCYRFHYLHFRLCGRKKKKRRNCRGLHHPSMVQSTMLLPAVCLINSCVSHWVCVIGASKVFRSTLCLIAVEVKSMRHIPCSEKFILSF